MLDAPVQGTWTAHHIHGSPWNRLGQPTDDAVCDPSSVVPYRKMGVYMGMFNFFIVIPQILAAALLGLLVRTVFHGHAIDAIVMGGISMILAAVLMLRVRDERTAV